MAPGEGDTWHARCHTHKLHVSRLLRRKTCGGGLIHPQPIKVLIKIIIIIIGKERKAKEREGKGGCALRRGYWVSSWEEEKKERKERKVRKKKKKKGRRRREPNQHHAVIGPEQAQNGTAL